MLSINAYNQDMFSVLNELFHFFLSFSFTFSSYTQETGTAEFNTVTLNNTCNTSIGIGIESMKNRENLEFMNESSVCDKLVGQFYCFCLRAIIFKVLYQSQRHKTVADVYICKYQGWCIKKITISAVLVVLFLYFQKGLSQMVDEQSNSKIMF